MKKAEINLKIIKKRLQFERRV